MKIIICIPHNFAYFEKPFTISLLELIVYTNWWIQKEKKDIDISVITQDGLFLDCMRNRLVEAALQTDQTHLLFLDADMTFPRNAIQLMVEDFEDTPQLEAVTGLYTWKRPPFLPHVYTSWNDETKQFQIAGKFPLTEPFWVEGAGAGCLMVKAEVFKRIKSPWFLFERETGEGQLCEATFGEDLYFCKKAKMEMVCDPRISCGHYKAKSYNVNDYIDSNHLLRTPDGNFEVTQEQIEFIGEEHLKRKGT